MDIISIAFFLAAVILFFVVIGISTQIRKQTDLLKAILAALKEDPATGDKVAWFNDDLPNDPLYKPRTLADQPSKRV
jgi:hypothetical protein